MFLNACVIILLSLAVTHYHMSDEPNKSKCYTSTFVYYVKIEFNFYLEKYWSGQNQSSRTVFTGPIYMYHTVV